MRFREASERDVAHVVPMVVAQYALHTGWEAARWQPRPGFEAGYGRWLGQRAVDERSVFLVATAGEEDDAVPVAFIIGTVEAEIPVYLLREYGFIHDVYVMEAYRNEGVARQLVTLAVEKFARIGVTQVRADTAQVNDAARSLLGKAGFRASSVVMLLEL
jgi:ribosomal protein S18 acetylase RimI-like enzyme